MEKRRKAFAARLGVAVVAILAAAVASVPAAAVDPACHPPVDQKAPQYIVGYGSLMEQASKQRTAPNTGENLPVQVTGYQRKWNSRGSLIGFSTTYLGIEPASGVRMVAALYRVFAAADIAATDTREAEYCREKVAPADIRMLDGSAAPEQGQIWIYVNKKDATLPPSERFPIVQSYVDIFLGGCIELEAKVEDKSASFADACIDTTAGWSEHWVNDRLYPRRPFIHQPNAGKIDSLLQRKLPGYFEKIRIE